MNLGSWIAEKSIIKGTIQEEDVAIHENGSFAWSLGPGSVLAQAKRFVVVCANKMDAG